MTGDVFSRPLRSLRLSVTDRCNLRCSYCMPEEHYDWLAQDALLSFDELTRLVRRFVALGVEKVRLTGGEPLLRPALPSLVASLRGLGLAELALTTNGVLLAEHAQALHHAGLSTITVSLDSSSDEGFKALARRDSFSRVVAGIDAALAVGLTVKLDTVLVRGRNDDQVAPLLEFARQRAAELRFIEYMDVGGATRWSAEQVVSRESILRQLGPVQALPGRGSAPAERFRLPSGQTFGIIASTTQPFCGACDRARITADGQLLTCLYATRGVDLRTPLRAGASDEELERLLSLTWRGRKDRGAESRLELRRARGPFRSVNELREEPTLEMHRRGG
jgi:cyclic pyranopterin phosphate synthase